MPALHVLGEIPANATERKASVVLFKHDSEVRLLSVACQAHKVCQVPRGATEGGHIPLLARCETFISGAYR